MKKTIKHKVVKDNSLGVNRSDAAGVSPATSYISPFTSPSSPSLPYLVFQSPFLLHMLRNKF